MVNKPLRALLKSIFQSPQKNIQEYERVYIYICVCIYIHICRTNRVDFINSSVNFTLSSVSNIMTHNKLPYDWIFLFIQKTSPTSDVLQIRIWLNVHNGIFHTHTHTHRVTTNCLILNDYRNTIVNIHVSFLKKRGE